MSSESTQNNNETVEKSLEEYNDQAEMLGVQDIMFPGKNMIQKMRTRVRTVILQRPDKPAGQLQT